MNPRDRPTAHLVEGLIPDGKQTTSWAETGTPETISVVVPTLNCADTLAVQLDALSRQTDDGPLEVIIADNGSTDGTTDVARAWASDLDIRVVAVTGLKRASFARNRGAMAGRGDAVAFCDGDDVVLDTWLAGVRSGLRMADVSVGPVLRFTATPPPAPPPESGRRPGMLGAFLQTPGGNTAVRRSVFEDLGGFDERLVLGEDAEFGLRARRAGYSVAYEPAMAVHYRQPDRLGAIAKKCHGYARAAVVVAREYPEVGLPTGPVHAAGLYQLATRAPLLPVSRPHRRHWFKVLGRTTGRAAGWLDTVRRNNYEPPEPVDSISPTWTTDQTRGC